MPLQNRVQPDGTIRAIPDRGLFMGNRGILHDENGLTNARWRHKAWVTCVLSFKNRRRKLMQPGAYTELFFLDETVALAAGHRPCGECRRADFNLFKQALDWSENITGLDTILHAERSIPRRFEQRRHETDIATLPDGAMILTADGPGLLWQDALLPYNPNGYGPPPKPRPNGTVTVLTPPTTCTALHNGYRPQVHPSASSL